MSTAVHGMSGVPANGAASSSMSQVTSEVAHDLLLDHLGTVLALLDAPLEHAALVARLGSEQTLQRMLRYGLIVKNPDPGPPTYSGVARTYATLRQEGMMSFLERYVLPVLTESVADRGLVTLHNLTLRLEPEVRAGLRAGPVQSLVESLSAITDRPRTGLAAEMTVLIIGTSKVSPECDQLEDGDRALHHLRQASLQRSTPHEKDQALLTQFRGIADNSRYAASLEAVQGFVSGLQARACKPSEANYHLTVASHLSLPWASSSPAPDAVLGSGTDQDLTGPEQYKLC